MCFSDFFEVADITADIENAYWDSESGFVNADIFYTKESNQKYDDTFVCICEAESDLTGYQAFYQDSNFMRYIKLSDFASGEFPGFDVSDYEDGAYKLCIYRDKNDDGPIAVAGFVIDRSNGTGEGGSEDQDLGDE